ncbi:ribonuclease R [Candidatus Spongiihabitans sp.]|uniref:ribonuclease R n=1 Tax=Candidatus Spongiihabitans sp. TaxID=3101308 RepID=UPI003C7ACE0B
MKQKTDHNATKSGYQAAGYRAADSSGVPVASRLQILEYLARANQPAALQSICAHFNILSPEGVNALAGRLQRMSKNGYLLMDRKNRYGLPEKMDIVVGRVVGHAKGFGFVIPDQGGEDLYLHHNQMRKVLHGDRVLAKTKRIDSRGRKQGVIVEVLSERAREIVGHFHLQGGSGFVEPDDPRFARDISIPDNRFNGAKNGDIVVARIRQHPIEHKHAVGEIIEVVGRDLAPGMETEIAIRKHGVLTAWPDAVQAQLKKMARLLQSVAAEKKHEESARKKNGEQHHDQPRDQPRKDLRDLPLVTIDGEDAQDFDDAVYCEPRASGWRLVVAIADVSHYVKPGSALDCEAYVRGNSVYFPNRVVPMLPEDLSNGICSLKPDEDRYCMVCDMRIAQHGAVTKFHFYPALMRSRARLTYALVNAIVVEKDRHQRRAWAAVTPHLDHLYKMSLRLRKKRDRRGAIDFEFPEPVIEFDDKKRIRRISARQRNDAHKLIEECMLAANGCAAEFLQIHKGNHAIYRNHDGPDRDALNKLRQFLGVLGLTLTGGAQPVAKDYAKLLASVASDMARLVQIVLLRSLSQAVYSTDQIGHFALAMPIYGHFTSPIRRYCDLVVHRQINQILHPILHDGKSHTGKSRKVSPAEISPGISPEISPEINLSQIGEHCSFAERRADDATRDVIAWLKAEFMQEKIGQEFAGIISGVKEFGIFVQLNEIFVDGLVHVTGLGDDYYHFDPARYQLVGERSGRRFRLGDRVRIRVARVDLNEAKIDFDLISQSASPDRKSSGSTRGLSGQARNKNIGENKPRGFG